MVHDNGKLIRNLSAYFKECGEREYEFGFSYMIKRITSDDSGSIIAKVF
jgi:hypothetical protein